ncbi:MAG: GNAT family N-acetyltransferase [Burkholderiales bacterium]
MKFSIQLSDTTSEEVRQAILAPLREYNQSQTGANEYRGLAIEVRDEQGSTIGGLWGGTSYEWLFIQLLVIPETLRGQGIGRRVMSMAEAEATSRACSAVWLDTFEFQARSFYERLGYTCFGQLENYPKGFARYFMQKSLA